MSKDYEFTITFTVLGTSKKSARADLMEELAWSDLPFAREVIDLEQVKKDAYLDGYEEGARDAMAS